MNQAQQSIFQVGIWRLPEGENLVMPLVTVKATVHPDAYSTGMDCWSDGPHLLCLPDSTPLGGPLSQGLWA